MFRVSFHVFFSPLSYIYISSRIFDNVISKWTFCVRQFSSSQKLWVAILKTKRSFPYPHSFSFSFSFPFPSLLWFWSFSGLRNLPFDAFSLKWLQISLGWFSKNRLDDNVYYGHFRLNNTQTEIFQPSYASSKVKNETMPSEIGLPMTLTSGEFLNQKPSHG